MKKGWGGKMRVLLPADRIAYLEKEVKARQKFINFYLRPGIYKPGIEEEIEQLKEEIRAIDDEIEELEEANERGREIYK